MARIPQNNRNFSNEISNTRHPIVVPWGKNPLVTHRHLCDFTANSPKSRQATGVLDVITDGAIALNVKHKSEPPL